jgi:hypothetical protein
MVASDLHDCLDRAHLRQQRQINFFFFQSYGDGIERELLF